MRRRSAARAGDGARTRDPQLGRLMLYQLSYARARPRATKWWGKDSNLRSAKRGRFTVCSLWPLGHPTAPSPPPSPPPLPPTLPLTTDPPRRWRGGCLFLLLFRRELPTGLEPLTC